MSSHFSNFFVLSEGFLATSTNASAGNYGMLDQLAAIQWVRENIHAFNGDRDMITLFGPGAGGASAGLLALSPLSRRKRLLPDILSLRSSINNYLSTLLSLFKFRFG